MSDGYYRVDALHPEARGGTSEFFRGPNKDAVADAFREAFPDLADWDLAVHRIKREEYPMTDLEVLVLPTAEEAVPKAPEAEREEEYSAWTAGYIRDELLARKTPENPAPRLLVQAPTDTTEEGNDSRDLVTLGRHGEVVVVDRGVR